MCKIPLVCMTMWVGCLPRALLAEGAVECSAEQLLSLADAAGGQVSLLSPPVEVLRPESGRILLFRACPLVERLSLTIPLQEDGYYRVRSCLVFGPWREGRYGMYRAQADGVPLPGSGGRDYYHGWYGRGTIPPYQLQWMDWGIAYFRKPSVDLTFVRDKTHPGVLLGIERIRFETVDETRLTEAERNRRVPKRNEAGAATIREADPSCTIEAESPLTWVTSIRAPEKPVRIDGDLSDWNLTKPLIIINAVSVKTHGYGAPPPKDDTDWSAVGSAAWDNDNLYLAAQVKDDALAETAKGRSWSSFWSHDGVVLLLHTPHWVRKRVEPVAVVQDTLTVGFNYYSPNCNPRELPMGITYRCGSLQGGYTLEASIPFRALGFRPQAGDRLGFMLIGVDIDPNAPAGERFQQYLWNTRGGDARVWGELRLLWPEGWGADIAPESDSYIAGELLRYVGVVDNVDKERMLKAVEIIDTASEKVTHSIPVGKQLKPNRRYRLRGALLVPALPPGRYDLRLSVQ